MTSSAPVRWGMIGCGAVTEQKSAPAYQNTPGFTLYGVMARNPDKTQAYAQRHNISRTYNSAQSMINDPNIDAVYIATPPDSHLEYALMVADAGKPCCVEKPMALNFEQASQMCQRFKEINQPLFVAYYRRCLPGFERIKQWIDEGYIGQPRHIDWQYTRSPSKLDLSGKPNWRTDAKIAPGGYFDDLACHGINIMTYLLGDVSQARGLSTNQTGLYSAKDAVVAQLLFQSGATATGCWNFASQIAQDKVTICGSAGQIQFGIFSDNPAVLNTLNGQQTCEMTKPNPIQEHFVEAMHAHLSGHSNHPSLAASAAHTNWIMDRILARR